MQQGFEGSRGSAMDTARGGMQLRSSALARSAVRLSGERVTARRDPATDDRMRMIRVMLDSAEKMMVRLGIALPEPVPAQV